MDGTPPRHNKCCLCRIRKCYEDEKRHLWGICERCKDIISEEWF